MKSIPLTKDKYALVDDDDYSELVKYRWHAKSSKGNFYAATRIRSEIVFMHNLLLEERVGLEVDHKDQDGLNNRRGNLRYATRSQNRANVSRRSDNRSGYKGVCYYKHTNKWRAYIQKDRKWKQLGFYLTKEEAARAYNKAATELFGEFAWLNKI